MKWPSAIGKKSMRVIVDSGVARNGSLMQQAKSWLGDRAADYCLLDEEHRAIPDVEILDKVLARDTVLITKDRVLHNRACRKGFRSLILNKDGKLTERPLPGIRLPKHEAPSIAKKLRSDYVHAPSTLAIKLRRRFSEKELKKCRRRRRRIRSYFGSADNIAKASLTISSRQGRGGPIYGFMLNLAGKAGVKGLKASEGYCRSADGSDDPGFCVMHALSDLYVLDLDQTAVDLFVMPPDSVKLVQRLLGCDDDRSLTVNSRALHMLLAGLSDIAVEPCVKGRFHDMAQRKLEQLCRSRTNEVVTVDFAAMVRDVIAPLPPDEIADGPSA